MHGQVTLSSISGLHALLVDPASAAGPPVLRVTTRGIRLGVAALDAAQLIVLALLLRACFPSAAATFTAAEVAGLATLAAVLAVPVRYSLHICLAPDPDSPSFAALRGTLAIAAAVAETGTLSWLALSRNGTHWSDLSWWFVAWFLSSATVAVALRFGAARLSRVLTGGQRVVVVGSPDEAEPFAHCVAQAQSGDWRFAGRVDDREPGSLEQLLRMINRGGVDVVALTMTGPDAATRTDSVRDWISDQPVRVCRALDTDSLTRLPPAVTHVGHFTLVDLLVVPQAGLDGAIKRAMDVVISGALLITLAPLLLLVALAIHLESPGPVLFRQWRFGLGTRPILVFKFRSMRFDGCDATGERRTAARDPRVTRIGRFIRRTSIDELPQLLNVLRGDMSLVGPRPHPLHMRIGDDYYFEAVGGYRVRHLVRPGITGWAQINGSRGEVDTLEKARRRVALDLWYVQNWSLMLDVRVILRTALGGFVTWRAD